MRPRRLALEGIGPYAQRAEVDFDDLAADGLFLIHGPTGAGKTFLLDAMCFALYGQVPGLRTPDKLRSDHATPSEPTVAELEFDAHGEQWRVVRSPPYERPKRRGTGTTQSPAAAHLFKREGREWKPMAARTTEVNRQIRDLVGLDHGQFARVMLLPQGQFQQVLQPADGQQREQLLTSLFDTELFAEIERWLEDRAKQAGLSVRHDDDRLIGLRRQAAERWHEVVGVDHHLDSPAEGVGIDELAGRSRDLAARAELTAARTEDALSAVRLAHQHGTETAQRWDRRAALLTELDRLHAGNDAVERLVAQRTSARRAAPVGTSLTAVDNAVRRSAAARDAARDAAAHLDHLVGSCPVALPRSFDPELLAASPEPAIADLAERRGRLVPLVDVAVRRDELAEQVDRLDRGATDQEAAAARHAARAAATADDLAAVTAELEACRSATLQVAAAQAAVHQATQRAQAVAALHGAQQMLTTSQADEVTARERHLDAKERHLAAREDYLDGIASTLAADLAAGDPCPVCGSVDHPAPATIRPSTVDRERVRVLAGMQERTADDLEQVVSRVADCRTEVAGLVGRADGCTDPAQAAEQVRALSGELDALTRAEARIGALQDRAAHLTTCAQDARSAALAARQEATAQRSESRTRTEELDGCAARLCDGLGDGVEPAVALTALEVIEAALATLVAAVRDRSQADRSRDEAEQRLDHDLERTGFADSHAARNALVDDERLAEMDAAITAHRQETDRTVALLGSEELAHLPTGRPDVGGLHVALSDAERAHRDAVVAATAARSAADAIHIWADAHGTLDAEAVERRNDAAVACRLWETVGGRSGSRVSLRRWVLAAYLEDICVLATQRLHVMTAGRYTLVVHRGGTPRNRLAGLDLRVLDAHTGEERDVSTLSGGETFQASLALALAVADAVQHHSGGVRMDALFIDEGFGTLDPDALELAMDELDALRAGGRMVGVISHVGTMRERIRTGIEVIPSERGSTVRVGQISA